MVQTVEMSELEKYEMYMDFEKEQVVRMLMECHKTIDKLTPLVQAECMQYQPNATSTGMECINCGKGIYMH